MSRSGTFEALRKKCPLMTKADIPIPFSGPVSDFYGFTKFVGWPSPGSIIRPTA